MDCGGFYEGFIVSNRVNKIEWNELLAHFVSGSDAVAPLNLLNILLLTSSNFGVSSDLVPDYQQASPLSLSLQPQSPISGSGGQSAPASLTNILLSGLTGVYKSGRHLVSELKKSKDKTPKFIFDRGMEKLRTDRILSEYVKRIKNPFNAAGKVDRRRIKPEGIKPQLKSRKIPCRRIARASSKARKICRDIRRRRLSAAKKVKSRKRKRRPLL